MPTINYDAMYCRHQCMKWTKYKMHMYANWLISLESITRINLFMPSDATIENSRANNKSSKIIFVALALEKCDEWKSPILLEICVRYRFMIRVHNNDLIFIPFVVLHFGVFITIQFPRIFLVFSLHALIRCFSELQKVAFPSLSPSFSLDQRCFRKIGTQISQPPKKRIKNRRNEMINTEQFECV